jgi:diacylglycerol kinase (ATP)
MLESVRHIARAARHSLAGLRYLVRSEMAARIEVAAGVLALFWFIVLRRSAGEILLLTILFCVLLSVEALNTGLERLVEQISPAQSDFARITKDLGSTAVFFLLLASGLFVLAVTADWAGAIALADISR